MKTVHIVGGGVSGIFLALNLIRQKIHVKLYEGTSSLGKKFLVAGKSDLNITHSEENMHSKYFKDQKIFKSMFNDFSNEEFVHWLKDSDIETYVGSSGRVFPKGIKAAKMLKIWSYELKESEFCDIFYEYKLTKFSPGKLEFNRCVDISAENVVFALGGGSWKVTGSSGEWLDLFKNNNIKCNDLKPSNNGIVYDHSDFFLDKYRFTPFKNVQVSCGQMIVQGDVLITDKGFEGTPIYSISNPLREASSFFVNFKPDIDPSLLKKKILERNKKNSLPRFLEKNLNLNKKVFIFFRELYSSEQIAENLFELITNFEIKSLGPVAIDESISTVGGVDMEELTENLELKKIPGFYVMGEMVDFDTITGGYLIQGCLSMAYRVFQNI